ncbi:MAG: 3-dehydroquinate synthase [Thermoflavifilum sp.]|nr:3-dehydroquinate synthase [Thermoflavifilum sp.]
MAKPRLFQRTIDGQTTTYYVNHSRNQLRNLVPADRTILLVDEEVARLYPDMLASWPAITVPSGESSKSWDTLHWLIEQLIHMEVDRSYTLVGVGGGVVTDLTGFLASIYMRGIAFGFLPTTLLAQVDASIGGKNGIDVGPYKNLIGTIRQPAFILIDLDWLHTLPLAEWQNGFAEIIKYACILDEELFVYLEQHAQEALRGEMEVVAHLVDVSLQHKLHVVQADPREKGMRRWLNFGHTLGHAIEKLLNISHGRAISIGMAVASRLSGQLAGLNAADANRILRLLEAYGLPTNSPSLDWDLVWDCLLHDKKREKDVLHLVLLEAIGKAQMKPIAMDELKSLLMAAH